MIKIVAKLTFLTIFTYSDTKAGVHKERGWPSSAYGMSKVAVTSMSLIHYKDLDAKGCDIVVNAVSVEVMFILYSDLCQLIVTVRQEACWPI